LCAILAGTPLFVRAQMAGGGVARPAVLEGNVGYLRVTETETNLPTEIESALNSMVATNSITGIVLDLRFAGGSGAGSVKPAEDMLEAEKLPLAILVNAQTRGAAADLANGLRGADAGLIFGGAATNIQPDMIVAVSATDEKGFLKNPYGVLEGSETNDDANTNFLPYIDIDRTTEADLVHDKIKDGDEDDSTDTTPEPQIPFIRDPVLAHGVDFLKGMAALHSNKS